MYHWEAGGSNTGIECFKAQLCQNGIKLPNQIMQISSVEAHDHL